MLGNTEGVHWRIARRRLRGITQQAVAPTPPASHHVVAVAFGHPGAFLPTDRGVLVVEIFVMDANTSNNVLFDLYDLIG